jgi:hypothetical protein
VWHTIKLERNTACCFRTRSILSGRLSTRLFCDNGDIISLSYNIFNTDIVMAEYWKSAVSAHYPVPEPSSGSSLHEESSASADSVNLSSPDSGANNARYSFVIHPSRKPSTKRVPNTREALSAFYEIFTGKMSGSNERLRRRRTKSSD